jgi:hypothetical protein
MGTIERGTCLALSRKLKRDEGALVSPPSHSAATGVARLSEADTFSAAYPSNIEDEL